MSRRHTEYPAEFRRQIVELHRAGRSVRSLAQEFEPSDQTIHNWIKQAELDAGERKDGLTSMENEELRRLRRENKQLKMERDILSKAAAWFARETGTIPEGSSGS
jgi:transposase